MRRRLILLVVLGFGAGATRANAADYQGYVVSVFPYMGKVYAVLKNGVFNGAGSTCATTGDSMVYAVDPGTAFGRTLISVLLSAKVTERLVYAVGDGACASVPYSPQQQGEGLLGADLKG